MLPMPKKEEYLKFSFVNRECIISQYNFPNLEIENQTKTNQVKVSSV